MIVYVVEEGEDYESSKVLGVHRTLAGAQAANPRPWWDSAADDILISQDGFGWWITIQAIKVQP